MRIGKINLSTRDGRAEALRVVTVGDPVGPAGLNQDQRSGHEVETTANGKIAVVARRSA